MGSEMTVDDLIAEAEKLARPCLLLNTEGKGEVVGYWRGERQDRPNAVPPEATALRSIEHIMTIDAGLLARVGIKQPFSSIGFAAVEQVNGDMVYRVLGSGSSLTELQCDGLPLYLTEDKSFPPFEAICLYGSERVAAWLKSLGLERHDYQQAQLESQAVEYSDFYMSRTSLYQGGADVVVGGWHQLWSDDDFYMPLEMRLAIWTLRDAEPWYELWQATGNGNWSVKERIT